MKQTIGIVEETLARVINPDLVQRINTLGGKAVGLAGTSVFTAGAPRPRTPRAANSSTSASSARSWNADTAIIDLAVAGEVVPVVSPVAREVGTGHTLNVNADIAACALAKKLKATKLIFLSDVLGVMRDPKDDSNSDSHARSEGRSTQLEAATASSPAA